MHTSSRAVSRSVSARRLVALALALSVGCGSSSDTPTAPVAPTPPAVAVAPTLPGASGNVLVDTDGALADADALVAGARVDRLTIPVAANERIRITVTSTGFDPVLQVQAPGAGMIANDDAAGDRTRSELDLLMARAGDLKVSVTTYAAGATGAYHVHAERILAAPVASAPVASASQFHQLPSQFRSYVASATPSAPGAEPTALPVRVGDRLQATLAAGDSTLPSGELADYYAFDVATPGHFTVQMQSSRLDSFLVVTTPTGERLQNDDSDGSRDASLELDARAAGQYRIVATSYRAGETGPYELKVLAGARDPSTATAPVAPSGPSTPPAPPTPSAPGGTQRGELGGTDTQLSSGEYFDEYGFDWPAGTPVHLEARSNQFDTYLIVRAPSGQQDDNDDQAPGVLNAGMDFVAREGGHYRVLVTSYAPGMRGMYELEVRGASGASTTPTPPTGPAPTPTPSTGAGPSTGAAQQRGELRAGDAQLSSGEFSDSYTYRFTPGDPVSIRLTSTDFDTYVIVRSPSGRQDDNDDFRPGELNAGFDIPAAEAGEYRVIVTSYQPGETGAYVLAVGGGTGGTGAPSGPSTPTTPGAPVTPGTGATHVWVVSVGISDYPGSGNDLPECANDARKIVEGLHNQGLSTTDREFLLVDAQATLANIRAAIGNVARQIQPNDTFVFFYSGHGGQATARTTDPDELDGVDEYIFVYDGQFMDDDMATAVDQVHALTLFSLDSCFAGGFAKDVVHRPGVIGMFSSEEDVTSGVASQFQAGGYLSHFLRLGIQGGADSDPHDTVTTVGELTHYMWSSWGEHASDVHMTEGYQQLVVDRGAVHNTEILWRLGR